MGGKPMEDPYPDQQISDLIDTLHFSYVEAVYHAKEVRRALTENDLLPQNSCLKSVAALALLRKSAEDLSNVLYPLTQQSNADI
jgi:hypothetical protein